MVKLLYVMPALATSAMAIPIAVHMPRFYSDVILAPLGYIAIALALSLFHALRIGPAGRMMDRPVDRDTIEAHLKGLGCRVTERHQSAEASATGRYDT